MYIHSSCRLIGTVAVKLYNLHIHTDMVFGRMQATKLRRTIIDSDAKKEKRRIAHSTPGSRIVKPARKRKIITELE